MAINQFGITNPILVEAREMLTYTIELRKDFVKDFILYELVICISTIMLLIGIYMRGSFYIPLAAASIFIGICIYGIFRDIIIDNSIGETSNIIYNNSTKYINIEKLYALSHSIHEIKAKIEISKTWMKCIILAYLIAVSFLVLTNILGLV